MAQAARPWAPSSRRPESWSDKAFWWPSTPRRVRGTDTVDEDGLRGIEDRFGFGC
jgi:hypothetical protein